MKICTKCGEQKEESEYYMRSGYSSRYAHCKACHRKMTSSAERPRPNREQRNRDRMERYHRDPQAHQTRWKAGRYVLTVEQVTEIINSPCSMCGATESGIKNKAMYIDHCHETGRVRGPLCHRCNQYVGWRENNKHLEEAYERHINGAY